MPGGINISAKTAAAIAGQIAVVTTTLLEQPNPVALPPSNAPWRPPQWGRQAVYSLTVPPTRAQREAAVQNTVINPDGTTTYRKAPNQVLVFDAVMVVNHSLVATPTRIPLQTGVNASDHIFLQPNVISLEIGISDAQDSYSPGMWAGASSKSVSAFQTLDAIMRERLPCTLATRLRTYTNVFITNIAPIENNSTVAALKACITFEQLRLVAIAYQQTSARPNATDSTASGTVQTQVPTQSTTTNNGVSALTSTVGDSNLSSGSTANESGEGGLTTVGPYQFQVSNTEAEAIQKSLNIPGAGTFSSNNINTIPSSLGQ